MTFSEYVDDRNDLQRPMGLWGPLGGPAAYRIEGGRRPAPATSGPPRPEVHHSGTAHQDDAAEFRLEQHRKAAQADQVVARLRRLR